MMASIVRSFCLAACALGWAQPSPNVHAPAGKRYVYKQSGGKPQEMEIYFPPNWNPQAKKVPGLLLFHGGGWSGGHHGQFRYVCDYFARRGLVTATAGYAKHTPESQSRLPKTESRKRICVTDAKSAIRWMKLHADVLGVDPQRIIVGGCSAGGHIAVLATINPGLNDPADPPDVDTSVVAYLLWNPAFFAAGRDRDDQVDVFAHDTRNLAPSAFFFGANDGWKTASDTLYKRLRSQGRNTAMWVAEDVGHNFWLAHPWLDLTIREADRFLMALGLLDGEPTVNPDFSSGRLIPVP